MFPKKVAFTEIYLVFLFQLF